ncbi:MAG: low temperature requirement protein A [Acidobacteriota bacterium]
MSLRHWIRPPRLWPADSHSSGRRVTWLELFFDLIFVAAVAQVDAPLASDYSFVGVARFLAFFLLIWWAWTGHTLYSTRFDTDDLVQRSLTLVQMFAVAAMAANARDAFDSRSSAGFGAAYAAMRFILVVQYLRACRVAESRRLACHHAAGFGVAALLWLASALIPAPGRYWLWGLALVVDLGTPWLAVQHTRRFPPDAAHLPERFGLFTIILLGESVVAVMHGMESQETWPLAAAISAFQGMGIAFCIWWAYFDGAAGATSRFIRSTQDSVRFHVWTYAHLPLYLGIAIMGVGVKHVISLAPGSHLEPSEVWILCTAVALVIAALASIAGSADGAQERRDFGGYLLRQYLLAASALAVAPAGSYVPPVVLVSILTSLCVLQVVASVSGAKEPEPQQKSIDEVPEFGVEP